MTKSAQPRSAPDKDVKEQGEKPIFGPSGVHSSRDLAAHSSLDPRFPAPPVTRNTSEMSINLGTSPSSAPRLEKHRGNKRIKISSPKSVRASRSVPPDMVRKIGRELAAIDLKDAINMKLTSKAWGVFEAAGPVFTISCAGAEPKMFFLKVVSGDGGNPVMEEVDLLFPPPPGSSLCWGAANGLMALHNHDLNMTSLHCLMCGYQQLLAEIPSFMTPKGLYFQEGSTALAIMEVPKFGSRLYLQRFCESESDESDDEDLPDAQDPAEDYEHEEDEDEDLEFVAEEESNVKHLLLNANQKAKEGIQLLAKEENTAQHDEPNADEEDLDDEDLGGIHLTWAAYPETDCYRGMECLTFSSSMTFVAVTNQADIILNKRDRQVGQNMEEVILDIEDEEYVCIVNGRHVFTLQEQVYVCWLQRSKDDEKEVTAQVYLVESIDDALTPVSDIGDFCVYLGSNQPIVLPSKEKSAGRRRNTLYIEDWDGIRRGLCIIAVEIDTHLTTIIPFPHELESELTNETWVSTWVSPLCGQCPVAGPETHQPKPKAGFN